MTQINNKFPSLSCTYFKIRKEKKAMDQFKPNSNSPFEFENQLNSIFVCPPAHPPTHPPTYLNHRPKPPNQPPNHLAGVSFKKKEKYRK